MTTIRATTRVRRLGPWTAVSACGALVCLTAVVVLSLTSSPQEGIPGLPTAGPLTERGLPVARALRDLCAAGAIGLIVLAATVFAPDPGTPANQVGHLQRRSLRAAGIAALGWTIAGVGVLVFTYSDIAGNPVTAPGFAGELRWFVSEFDLGRSLMISVLISAAVTLGCALRPTFGGVGFLALLAVAALWPLALTGHAAGALNHATAVNLQFLHLTAISVWVGGLAALVGMLRGHTTTAASTLPMLRRYSTLAGWCLALVALSGIGGALIRVNTWDGLTTGYGALVLLKAALLTTLGLAGLIQRRRILRMRITPTSSDSTAARSPLTKIVVLELGVMCLAMALGVALGRTPPPAAASVEAQTVAESLLGFAMPPALDASGWFTAWRLDTLYTPLAVAGLVGYLCAVARLHRRGDSWNPGRTASWGLGCVLMIWATSGAPGVYGSVLFSMHMVQHMLIVTAIPPLLVLGAPVTLALRAIPRRDDGSRGPREWLLHVVHSLPMQLLGNPIIAAANFVGSMVIFYYSDLFETSLRNHTGHVVMVAHFLISGYMFASVMCGIDPGPRRPPYPLRALLLLITFGFHALFSVSLMSSNQVLARDWFTTLDVPWRPDLLDDQTLGAGFGWAMGEAPLLLMAGAMFAQWVMADRRERVRYDRQADRDNDTELAAYNAELAHRRQQSERFDQHRS